MLGTNKNNFLSSPGSARAIGRTTAEGEWTWKWPQQFEFMITPMKFNMEPENDGDQKESPFPGTYFQVPC